MGNPLCVRKSMHVLARVKEGTGMCSLLGCCGKCLVVNRNSQKAFGKSCDAMPLDRVEHADWQHLPAFHLKKPLKTKYGQIVRVQTTDLLRSYRTKVLFHR